MRALIRGTEICLENAWTKWQRMNILFLTGKEKDADGNPIPGDGWTLVEDYQEPVEGPEEFIRKAEVENLAPETVTIDGVTYTRTP